MIVISQSDLGIGENYSLVQRLNPWDKSVKHEIMYDFFFYLVMRRISQLEKWLPTNQGQHVFQPEGSKRAADEVFSFTLDFKKPPCVSMEFYQVKKLFLNPKRSLKKVPRSGVELFSTFSNMYIFQNFEVRWNIDYQDLSFSFKVYLKTGGVCPLLHVEVSLHRVFSVSFCSHLCYIHVTLQINQHG